MAKGKKSMNYKNIIWKVKNNYYPSINAMLSEEIRVMRLAIASGMLKPDELDKLQELGFKVGNDAAY